MGKRLQWSEARPTLLRALGRSGVEYQIAERSAGRWTLYRFAAAETWRVTDASNRVSDGWLADMKALAEELEADAIDPASTTPLMNWVRAKAGHYWGAAPSGVSYRISKISRSEWRLERFDNANVVTDNGTALDEGSLPSMKRRAVEDATAAALERRTEETAA